MRIQVHKCRFTGKIFEEKDRKKYIKHLKSLRVEMSEKRRIDIVRRTFKDWLAKEKKNILHPNDIPEWFLKNQRMIMDACNSGKFSNDFYKRDRFVNSDKFEKLNFDRVTFNKNASNSHVCPHNGVTNWHVDVSRPTGYVGWTGVLSGSLKRPKGSNASYPSSEALNIIGIKTGTGGGGNESFGYGFTIFLADWPGLKHTVDNMERDEIVAKLKGK